MQLFSLFGHLTFSVTLPVFEIRSDFGVITTFGATLSGGGDPWLPDPPPPPGGALAMTNSREAIGPTLP